MASKKRGKRSRGLSGLPADHLLHTSSALLTAYDKTSNLVARVVATPEDERARLCPEVIRDSLYTAMLMGAAVAHGKSSDRDLNEIMSGDATAIQRLQELEDATNSAISAACFKDRGGKIGKPKPPSEREIDVLLEKSVHRAPFTPGYLSGIFRRKRK